MNELANEALLTPDLTIQKGKIFQFKFLHSKWLIHSLALLLVCMPSLLSIPLWLSKSQVVEFQMVNRMSNLPPNLTATEVADAIDMVFYRTIFINIAGIIIYLSNVLYWIPAFFIATNGAFMQLLFFCVPYFLEPVVLLSVIW